MTDWSPEQIISGMIRDSAPLTDAELQKAIERLQAILKNRQQAKRKIENLLSCTNDLMTSIPFNIWDDYYDDGYVPEGEVQETHGYIEEYDELTDEQKAPILKLIYDYIMTLDMEGVEVEIRGEDINFTHLTHEKLERLLMSLATSELKYNGIPIVFYSES